MRRQLVRGLPCTFVACCLLISYQMASAQAPQPAARVLEEAQTVYWGNMARRQNGVPPLRWNWQLTQAARWFSWDSVENRSAPFCGHQDTQGNWPGWRAATYGYKGAAGAENAFCGYLSPQAAIAGWMNSPGHRANLLDAGSHEIGLGYYLRSSDGRGYVTQDFGRDSVYAPVIIENEAVDTLSPAVDLYIYSEDGGGWSGMGHAVDMLVSNNPCFTGVGWEPYTSEKTWSLSPGVGWRTVYVKTRDALQRTAVVSDVIYLGGTASPAELGAAQMSNTQSQVTLYNLDVPGWLLMQFSLGWAADDTFGTFHLWWGNGERVTDAAALGGTAFCLRPGNGESFAWVWTTDFIRDVPLVGYVRLKVSDNHSSDEVARFSIKGGGQEYGPVRLKGTDFAAANVYQEFPLRFVFHSNASDPFLMFNFWRSGVVDLSVDSLTIYTVPQAMAPSLVWSVPGGNYRGQGVRVRYTDGQGHFSAATEADTLPSSLAALPETLLLLTDTSETAPWSRIDVRCGGCRSFEWQAHSDAAWLQVQKTAANALRVTADVAGRGVGEYRGTVTIQPAAGAPSAVKAVTVPVTLRVVERLAHTYFPCAVRDGTRP